ncbi:MAG: SurA N-terminal domain-containing protein [Alphaproteobacteria bacterium]
MLQALRQQASSWVVKILLGLLIASFAIWGINDIFLGERDPMVAKVGSIKIVSSELNESFRDEINRMAPLFGGQLDREKARQIGLLDRALYGLIDRAVYSLGSADLGIAISDQLIRKEIREEPSFRNRRGEFDPAIFRQVISSNNMSEEGYINFLRQGLARTYLSTAITAHAEVPSQMLDPLYRFRNERRSAEYVKVTNASVTVIGTPGEAAIAAFHKSHSARFMAPEFRSVTFVNLDPNILAEGVDVPDDKLRKEYEDRIGEFTIRGRRKVEQIVFKKEATAKRASDLLREGAKFAAVGATVGNKSAEMVSLGWLTQAELIPEIAKATFALADGGITKPIKSVLGWHLVRVTGSKKGRVKSFNEVRAQLKKSIAVASATEAIYRLANRFEDALAGGSTIEEAARQHSLKAVKIDAIDARGRGRSGVPVKGLPSGDEFLRTMLSTPELQESQLTETAEGGYFLLRVNKVIPPELKPLAVVRNQVIKAWQQDRRAAAASKRAQAILDRVKRGENLKAVASAEKLVLKQAASFTRIGAGAANGLTPALVTKLFSLKPGQAGMARTSDGFVVAVLKDIKGADANAKKAKDEMRQALGRGISDDLLGQFTGALRNQFGVEINQKTIEARLLADR